MNFAWLEDANTRELEQFKSVCNQLLSRTFVVRTLYKQGQGRINNPDYTFLASHYAQVRDYLLLLDWDLQRDDLNGYFYVRNTSEANRLNLDKKETGLLLALRMIYEESQESLGLEQDAVCTVRDLLEKVVTDHPILPAKPNMEDVKRTLTRFENHCILQRLEGKYNKPDCRFTILPTIQTVVAADRISLVAAALRKEEPNEEAEEDSAG